MSGTPGKMQDLPGPSGLDMGKFPFMGHSFLSPTSTLSTAFLNHNRNKWTEVG